MSNTRFNAPMISINRLCHIAKLDLLIIIEKEFYIFMYGTLIAFESQNIITSSLHNCL